MATTSWTAFSNIAAVGPSITTYQDIIATTIASASYYVQAYNIVGTATGSNIVYVASSASLPPPPPEPTSFDLMINVPSTPGTASLSW